VNTPSESTAGLAGVRPRLLAVPLLIKIMGIGGVVAVIFGAVIGYTVQETMAERLYRDLAEAARVGARLLSESLTRPVVIEDVATIRQVVRNGVEAIPDFSFIVVLRPGGDVVAHSFPKAVPREVLDQPVPGRSGAIRKLALHGGTLLVASAPILDGRAGHVQVGVGDGRVLQALEATQATILWTLAGCMALGQLLAMVLGLILTRPIHHLVHVADELRAGRLDSRATIRPGDEVGQLSAAFNRLADSIQDFQARVRQDEEQRRILLKKLVLSHEEERRRVALELHDELGPSLSSLRISAGTLAGRSGVDDVAAADLEQRIGQVIDGVRRMAFLLRPSVLDDYGLAAALKRYAEDVTRQGALNVDCQVVGVSPGDRFPPDVEIALYRIAQEAVTNVLRHARATTASIVLVRRHGSLSLVVEDDGCGMDPHAPEAGAASGVGLAGMRERAHLIGGMLNIESSRGSGTAIKATVPIQET